MSRASSISRYERPSSVASAFATPSNFPSRAHTPLRNEAEWQHMYAQRRAASKSRTPVPSYTDALCAVSRRLRERSIPPPLPPPYQELSRPRAVSRGRAGRPPLPPTYNTQPQAPASDYYKKYIKSIYEREPAFNDYIRSLPAEEVNVYNVDSMARIKGEFHDMISDKWGRKGCNDPSVEHDIGAKLYPWRSVVVRDAEPASERLRKIHAERARGDSPPRLPKIRVYHRSTWQH